MGLRTTSVFASVLAAGLALAALGLRRRTGRRRWPTSARNSPFSTSSCSGSAPSSTPPAASRCRSGAGSTLDRVNALEAEITRLTGKIEELEFRIQSLVRDGTNRIGDLEFRLCELEADCDISEPRRHADAGRRRAAGGGAADRAGAAVGSRRRPIGAAAASWRWPSRPISTRRWRRSTPATSARRSAAVRPVRRDLSRRAADRRRAVHARRGAGRSRAQVAEAARAYLGAYSGDARRARTRRDALLKLGAALGELGQLTEACVTFGEVVTAFPRRPRWPTRRRARAALGCP